MPPAHAWRRVLAAETASNFGSMLSRLAIPWVATLVLDATPWQMGGLLVADVLAGALGALLLGALVDRAGKRGVMLAADLLRAALLALLALAVWQRTIGMAGLLLFAAAGALLTMAFEMARSAWMAQRLAAAELPTRNAQLSAAGSLSETAAFALGGWFYQWWGALVALLIDAASYLVSALCLRGIDAARVPATASTRAPAGAWRALWREMREGLASLASHPVLRRLGALEVLRALALSVAGTSWMIFVARDIGFEPGAIGLIAASGGLGALAGAAIAPRLGRRFGPARTMAVGLALAALGAACTPLVPGLGLAGIALLVAQQVVGDAGHIVHEVHDRTLRQTAVDASRLARVDGGLRTLGQLATLAGALGGGWLASSASTRVALAACAGMLVVAALLALRLPGSGGEFEQGSTR